MKPSVLALACVEAGSEAAGLSVTIGDACVSGASPGSPLLRGTAATGAAVKCMACLKEADAARSFACELLKCWKMHVSAACSHSGAASMCSND